MSKATDDLMDTLHLITAEQLIDIVKNGVKVIDKEGELQTIPAPAAYIAAAIKFLKDNNITAEASSGRMKAVNSAVSNLPDFDEYEDEDRPYTN